MKLLSTPVQLNLLAEQIGNFIEYWGFKKIHGMIWTHLYLSPVPLSAQELIGRLKVSKALISLSMKDLLHYELVTQTEDSLQKKNKFYTINPEIFNAIRGVLEARELHMMSRIEGEFQALASLSKDQNSLTLIEPERLESLGQMIGGAGGALRDLIALAEIDPNFLQNSLKY